MKKPSLKSTLVCIVEVCDRPYSSRGYCKAHYKQFKKHGRILSETIMTKRSVCTIEDCETKHFCKGYCVKHYQQLKRNSHICSEKCKAQHRKDAHPKGKTHNTGRTHFEKGRTPWCKGVKNWMSEDHIAAIKRANTGRLPWNKGKTLNIVPWNKIGDGVTSENKLLRTKFNRTTAAQVLKRDNYTCQICEQHGCHLHIDHIKSWSKYPELRFELSNCRALCRACHYYITFKKIMPDSSTWGLTSVTKKAG